MSQSTGLDPAATIVRRAGDAPVSHAPLAEAHVRPRSAFSCGDTKVANRDGRSAMPTFSPEVALWLALRRVRKGHVRVHPPDLVTDGGRRLPEYLHVAMRELFDNGHVRLGAGHEGGQPAVKITASGEDLFAELDQEHRITMSEKDKSVNRGKAP